MDASPKPASSSLFAIVWAMLRQLAALMFTPGADRSLSGLMRQLEDRLAQAILAQAIELAGGGIDPATIDIRTRWTRSGQLVFDLRQAPSAQLTLVRAEQRRQRLNRPRPRFTRCTQFIWRFERRRRKRAIRTIAHRAPLLAVPP